MHYNQSSFIISSFLIATISQAMENTEKFNLYKIQEITAVENPRCVRYVKNNCVAISSSRECNILDLETKSLLCVNKLNNCWDYVNSPILEITRNKIISSIDKKITIYDMQVGKEICFMPKQQEAWSLAVNPHDDTIFLSYAREKTVLEYNYTNDSSQYIHSDEKNCWLIDIHPSKKIMCIANCLGDISVRSLNNLNERLKTITLPKPKQSIYNFCQFSRDGSYIVTGNKEKIYILDANKKTHACPLIKHLKNERFNAIAFHPDGSMLAALTTRNISSVDKKVVIHYWNLKTKKFIFTSPELDSNGGYDLSFSHDGLEVIVALEDKCVRTLVPFAIKEKGAYILLWLNQIKKQKNLPQDVITHCINIFLRSLNF